MPIIEPTLISIHYILFSLSIKLIISKNNQERFLLDMVPKRSKDPIKNQDKKIPTNS